MAPRDAEGWSNPFTDEVLVRDQLYARPERIEDRGQGLYAAKTRGANAAAMIAGLVAASGAPLRTIADVGGGTGRIARHLAVRFPHASVVVLDRSPGLLRAARRHLAGVANARSGICGDFHRLPFPAAGVDVAVAAFCLYHSPRPRDVISELARSVTGEGRVIVATKSMDSYRELDDLVASSGLDPGARDRPSLYSTFHSGNAAELAATAALRVDREVHHAHEFCFGDFDRLAEYMATSPKYRLPPALAGRPSELAKELRRRLPERPLTMTSTVTYVTGGPL